MHGTTCFHAVSQSARNDMKALVCICNDCECDSKSIEAMRELEMEKAKKKADDEKDTGNVALEPLAVAAGPAKCKHGLSN